MSETEKNAETTPIGIADELLKLKNLKDEGILTEAEFNKQKDKILNQEAKKVSVKEDSTITVRHKINKRTETVSIDDWEKMKELYGENNYEIIKSNVIVDEQPTQNTINVNHQIISKSNGIGTAGFVLALIALFLGCIPYIGWVLWFLGLIFSFIGIFKKPAGLAIAGLIISLIDIILLIAVFGAIIGSLSL